MPLPPVPRPISLGHSPSGRFPEWPTSSMDCMVSRCSRRRCLAFLLNLCSSATSASAILSVGAHRTDCVAQGGRARSGGLQENGVRGCRGHCAKGLLAVMGPVLRLDNHDQSSRVSAPQRPLCCHLQTTCRTKSILILPCPYFRSELSL